MMDPSSLLSALDRIREACSYEERFGDDLPYAHSVDDDVLVDSEERDPPIPYDDLDDL